jgi:hypothetical protein
MFAVPSVDVFDDVPVKAENAPKVTNAVAAASTETDARSFFAVLRGDDEGDMAILGSG